MKVLSAIIALSLMVSLNVSFAQTLKGQDSYENFQDIAQTGNRDAIRLFDERYEGVKGSPYIFDDWESGKIYSKKGPYDYVKLNYDAYNNEIHIKTNRGIIFLDNSKVDSFKVKMEKGDVIYLNTLSVCKNCEIGDQFFVMEIARSNNSLLVERKDVDFLKADYKGAFSSGRTFDEYYSENSFYLISPDKIIKANNTKSIAEFFGIDKKELKKFINEKGLDTDNKEHLELILNKFA